MMDMMNIKPIGKRLLVQPLPAIPGDTGTIKIPETVRPEFGPVYSRVLRIGSRVKVVREGDRVLSYSHSKGAQDVPNSLFKIIDEDEILLVIRDGEIV